MTILCPIQDSSQIELLKELMDLLKDMVVMLLSMLEGMHKLHFTAVAYWNRLQMLYQYSLIMIQKSTTYWKGWTEGLFASFTDNMANNA